MVVTVATDVSNLLATAWNVIIESVIRSAWSFSLRLRYNVSLMVRCVGMDVGFGLHFI